MQVTPGTGERDLLRRLRDGDERAFEIVYERYQGRVFRFAMQMTGQEAMAEEITHDVFLELIREPLRYDETRGPLLPFLLGWARNLVARALERDWRYVRESEEESDQSLLPEPAVWRDLDAELVTRERIEELRKVIATLPLPFREAVALCDLQELDYETAAGVLGCPVGTVRSRLHRGRNLIAARMRSRQGCSI